VTGKYFQSTDHGSMGLKMALNRIVLILYVIDYLNDMVCGDLGC